MTTALDPTVKGTTANTYGTQVEASAYFDDRMFADAWVSAGDQNQQRVLLWSAKILDTRVKWKGSKTTQTQALSWPRAYVEDPEFAVYPPAAILNHGIAYLDADVLPRFIKWAQFEQALALLGSDITLDPLTQGYSNLSVGSISVAIDKLDKARVLPRPVRDLIAPYGTAQDGRSFTAKLMRT